MTARDNGFRKAIQELTDRLRATTSDCTGMAPKHWRGNEYADGFDDATDEAVEALKAILEAYPGWPLDESFEPWDSDCAKCATTDLEAAADAGAFSMRGLQ